jgi:hypothetical protein
MPQWKNTDAAANSVIWAPATVKTTANTTTRNALFGNTTADAFITGQTIGQFGVNPAETAANKAVAHAGWVLRKQGSGGRAGRVTFETLVAMGSITDDAEDAVMADALITILTQPIGANVAAPAGATFSVVASAAPSTATLTYVWQANTGSGFANLSNAGVYSNTTTPTLSISNSTGLTGAQYRALVLSTGANTVTSSAATLTVT